MLQREKNLEERLFLKQKEHMIQRQSSLAGELSPRSRRKEMDTNKKQMLSASSLLLPEQSSPPRARAVTFSGSKTLWDRDYRPVSSNLMKDSLGSSSLTSLPDDQSYPSRNRVMVSRSKTFSAWDRRPMSHGSKSAAILLPQSTLPTSDQQLSPQTRFRSKLFADSASIMSNNSLTSSLPDINAAIPHMGKTLRNNSEKTFHWKGFKTELNTSDEKICDIDDWEDLRKCRYLRTSSTEK